MADFISESTVHEYQYSIQHFPETSSLMSSGTGTNYDFSIWSRSSHSSLSLKELWTSFPDVAVATGSSSASSTCLTVPLVPSHPMSSSSTTPPTLHTPASLMELDRTTTQT